MPQMAAMKNKRKIVFLIAEGISDKTALAAVLSRLLTDEETVVEVTHGDITSKSGVSPSNIIKTVGDFVKKYAQQYFLKKEDFCEVVQIVDMDGAYIPDELVKENALCEKPRYLNSCIETCNPEGIRKRNSRKQRNLNRLIDAPCVWSSIPYSVYFFSCNLDHALHGDANLSEKDKNKRATDFAERYSKDSNGFLYLIGRGDIAPCKKYSESWEYIKTGANSLQRCTNLNVFLSSEAKSIQRGFS